MSYLVPFQSVALFENTFRHQINKKTGKIDERKFVFDKHFGDGKDDLPVVPDRYRLIWMSGCPHSNKAVITLRLLGLDKREILILWEDRLYRQFPEIANSIQIQEEKEKAYEELDDERNPYHLIFRGQEETSWK